MTYDELIEAMTPDMHRSLRQAVELGKWPDGKRLSDEQRETCMRAVIAYDTENLPPEQRVGYIDRTRKDGTQHGSDPLAPQTLKILSDAD
ncbi:MAG: YeaC family protein [Pontibacterium sp.]